MRKIIAKLNRRLRREEGVTAIEYGLLAALIALAIIIAVIAVGQGLNTTFSNVSTQLQSPGGGS
jgi:pilus assembly protein Flp/PilA